LKNRITEGNGEAGRHREADGGGDRKDKGVRKQSRKKEAKGSWRGEKGRKGGGEKRGNGGSKTWEG